MSEQHEYKKGVLGQGASAGASFRDRWGDGEASQGWWFVREVDGSG
jgi:hypothetical protein